MDEICPNVEDVPDVGSSRDGWMSEINRPGLGVQSGGPKTTSLSSSSLEDGLTAFSMSSGGLVYVIGQPTLCSHARSGLPLTLPLPPSRTPDPAVTAGRRKEHC